MASNIPENSHNDASDETSPDTLYMSKVNMLKFQKYIKI